jgi:site-specific recombinase XerD
MRTNNRLLNNFLTSKITDGKSENTIKGYESDLRFLLSYLKQKKINVTNSDITDLDAEFFKTIIYDDLEEYNNMLYNKGDSPLTRSRAISAIKQFFNYLQKKNIIIDNPANGLVKPKIPKKNPAYLSEEESKELLRKIEGEYKERDYAMLTLFLNCGFRLSELVEINLSDIKDNFVTVIRKGNEEQPIPLNSKCIEAINNYLEVRPKVEDDALFLSERKKRISTRTVQHFVKRYANSLNIDKDIHPHSLRHSCFTRLYSNGVDIKKIQQLANHKTIKTTADIYVHLTGKDLIDTVNSNPL